MSIKFYTLRSLSEEKTHTIDLTFLSCPGLLTLMLTQSTNQDDG